MIALVVIGLAFREWQKVRTLVFATLKRRLDFLMIAPVVIDLVFRESR